MYLRRILQTLPWAIALLGQASAGEPPRVVVSLPPLHSLTAAVMEGVGRPELLIEGGASPHRTALRPSAARKLAKATRVFWTGPELEFFVARALTNLGSDAMAVALLHAPGMTRLKPRETHDSHGKAAATDPHFWLDPENAVRITEVVAETLIAADPANARAYQRNREAAIRRLRALDEELGAALRPLAGRPFLVFHDSYAYLARRYGLGPMGAIAIDPERKPGARRLVLLRKRIHEQKIRCLFREPQFASPIVERLGEGAELRIETLDPLGSDLEPGPDLYGDMMRRNAVHLVRCLEGGKDS